jgi:hypothetical protein
MIASIKTQRPKRDYVEIRNGAHEQDAIIFELPETSVARHTKPAAETLRLVIVVSRELAAGCGWINAADSADAMIAATLGKLQGHA